MGKTYKAKLNISSSKLLRALKIMAGTYRKIYNLSMDLQENRVYHVSTYAHNTKAQRNMFFSRAELETCLNLTQDVSFPFSKYLDEGIKDSAISLAFSTFFKEYDFKFMKRMSRKKQNMKFKTNGKVKVFYDHITIPKLNAKIKLFEKGYIPQGKRYSNVTFSHDGKDWFISLEVLDDNEIKPELSDEIIFVDFDRSGALMRSSSKVQDVLYAENITNQKAYVKKENQLKKEMKKLKRQAKANSSMDKHTEHITTRVSRNMVKTRSKIQRIKNTLSNMKTDYFKKVANEVARTKPKELHLLSSKAIKYERMGFLTRDLRRNGTYQFYDIVKNKLAHLGTKLVMHDHTLDLLRAENTLGSRGFQACGA